MDTLSTHGFRFISCLEGVSDSTVEVGKINNLVYSFLIAESHLLILYYMPESTRISNFPGENVNLKYIHIDEDNWLSKPEVLLNRIRVLLGKGIRIFARECVVARIDKKVAIDFQEEHHLQLAIPGKYRYGLFLEGELMAIAIFSGGRTMRHTENYRSFECLRFCSKQQYVVVGGLSKLLQRFIYDFSPNDIMTYVDLDWSDGQKFERTGFERVDMLKPQVFWVNKETHERITTRAYQDLLDSDLFYEVVNMGSVKMIKYC